MRGGEGHIEREGRKGLEMEEVGADGYNYFADFHATLTMTCTPVRPGRSETGLMSGQPACRRLHFVGCGHPACFEANSP